MPEVTLGESQVEYLEELRDYVAEEHVGPYGHVRMREAVQFLIDQYESTSDGEAEALRRGVAAGLADRSYQELQSLAAETDGVEPKGTADELRERLVDARLEQVRTEESAPTQETEPADEPGATDDEDDGGDSSERDADASESGGNEEAGDETSDSGGSRLERMMGLLDHHDDAWEETDSEEGKYTVTLPDGETETVRTKDDVRALLFKHFE
jgi:hypothetical protein